MGNIRVSVKLAIGFSIIIVMTVVVALLGINNQRQPVHGCLLACLAWAI